MPNFDRARFAAMLDHSDVFTKAQTQALADALAAALSTVVETPPDPASPLRGAISDLT